MINANPTISYPTEPNEANNSSDQFSDAIIVSKDPSIAEKSKRFLPNPFTDLSTSQEELFDQLIYIIH